MYALMCVFFVHMAREISALPTKHDISLHIRHLDQWEWTNKDNSTKLYNFNFTEANATFDCLVDNRDQPAELYKLAIYLDGARIRSSQVYVPILTKIWIRKEMNLTKESDNVTCTAVPTGKGSNAVSLTNVIKLHYVPPTLLPETSPAIPLKTSPHNRGWLTGISVGCAILLIVCVAGCCAVFIYRKKKSSTEVVPNYTNLARENKFQTIPLRDLKASEKSRIEDKPKAVALDTYTGIKSPQIASEPYIEPYESDTYTVPYVASSNDTYADLYAPNDSNSNAPKHPCFPKVSNASKELCSPNDSNAPKELCSPKDSNAPNATAPSNQNAPDKPYAPIPKARRMTKANDDHHIDTYAESYLPTNDTADLSPKDQYIPKDSSAQENMSLQDSSAPKDLSLKDSSAPKDPYAPDEPNATPIPKARRNTRVEDYDYSSIFGNQK